MKNNKRFTLIFLFILISSVTIAHAQTEIGIKVGAHYSKVMTGDQQETQFIPGWHIGLSVDIPLVSEFYIQPGLLYARKGYSQESGWYNRSNNHITVKANYFELLVNFLYKPTLGSGKLLVGAGPYLGYGIGGKWKSEKPIIIGDIIHDDHGDIKFSDKALDGAPNSYVYGKPLDYGINLLVGYEFFNKISAQFNIRFGLRNLSPNYPGGSKRNDTFKNIGLGISLGYKL